MKYTISKSGIAFLFLVSATPLLSGCMVAVVAAGAAVASKVYYPYKPEIEYSIIDDGDILLNVESHSMNPYNTKSYVEAAAALVGKKRGCKTIREVSINYDPTNFKNVVKAEGSVLYNCGGRNEEGRGVSQILSMYAKEAEILESEGRLKPATGQPVATSKKQPSENEEVKSIQIALNNLGYNPGPADGIMGSKTREAIKLYQQDYDLPVTGRIDGDTVNLLIGE